MGAFPYPRLSGSIAAPVPLCSLGGIGGQRFFAQPMFRRPHQQKAIAMSLPSFWGEPSFSVAEVSELIGTPEVTLRSYLTRCPELDFLGRRDASRRVHLSGRDALYYLLVSDLSEYGVPVRSAMHVSAGIARTDPTEMNDYLVVRTNGGVSEFQHTDERPNDNRPALVLPIRALAEVLISDAAAVYAKDAT